MNWMGHRTLIVATHRRAVLALVDRIIVMNEENCDGWSTRSDFESIK